MKDNNLMSEKHKNICRALNYFEYFLVFVSGVCHCVSIPAFASLVGVPFGIVSSEVGRKYCAITSGIKKCKSKREEKKRTMK